MEIILADKEKKKRLGQVRCVFLDSEVKDPLGRRGLKMLAGEVSTGIRCLQILGLGF